jgi:hypothetical protein
LKKVVARISAEQEAFDPKLGKYSIHTYVKQQLEPRRAAAGHGNEPGKHLGRMRHMTAQGMKERR